MNNNNPMMPFWDGSQPVYGPLWTPGLLATLFGYQEAGGFRAEVRDTDACYLVRAELPGIDPERVCVSVERGVLSIALDVEEPHGNQQSRTFHLEGIDEDAVTAHATHGVLTVTLPKKKEQDDAKPRRIEIR